MPNKRFYKRGIKNTFCNKYTVNDFTIKDATNAFTVEMHCESFH